jgi:hypothetical protein
MISKLKKGAGNRGKKIQLWGIGYHLLARVVAALKAGVYKTFEMNPYSKFFRSLWRQQLFLEKSFRLRSHFTLQGLRPISGALQISQHKLSVSSLKCRFFWRGSLCLSPWLPMGLFDPVRSLKLL